MTGQRAIVTGGASGLGAVIARRLHDEGHHVIVIDRECDTGLARGLAGRSGISFVECDLLDRRQVSKAMSDIAPSGGLWLLVNNAGGWLPGAQYPEGDSWEQSLDLNLHAPMLLTKLALPMLRDGAVVNIASSAGSDSGPYGSPEYAAAKAGLIRFTTAAAALHASYGVRVSCVIPHWIGLPRAVTEYERLSPAERRRSGGLVDPEAAAAAVIDLGQDPSSAGRVVIVRPSLPPYEVDPADYDPHRQ